MTDAIKDLYPYALAEGEGVGTAYEYVAKARFIRPIIDKLGRLGSAARLLVAGLPEKYGTSLDFAILAARSGAELTVADDRPQALERARGAIDDVRASNGLPGLRVTFRRIDLSVLAELGAYDAVLSCEVLQRIAPATQPAFAAGLRSAAPLGAVFAPNSENGSHLAISGLRGFSLSELRGLLPGARLAYVDMPPFPPGIARSAKQRAKARTGLAEAMAMRVLDAYCAGERAVPNAVKRNLAHIVCAMWGA